MSEVIRSNGTRPMEIWDVPWWIWMVQDGKITPVACPDNSVIVIKHPETCFGYQRVEYIHANNYTYNDPRLFEGNYPIIEVDEGGKLVRYDPRWPDRPYKYEVWDFDYDPLETLTEPVMYHWDGRGFIARVEKFEWPWDEEPKE